MPEEGRHLPPARHTTSSSSWPPSSSSPLGSHPLSAAIVYGSTALAPLRGPLRRLLPLRALLRHLLLRHSRLTSSGCGVPTLEPHGLAADVRRLLAPPSLVVMEIDVELRQTDHGDAALDDGGVKHPGVVWRHEMHVAFVLAGPQSQRAGERFGIPLDIAMDGREAHIGCDEGGSCVQGESDTAARLLARPREIAYQLARDALRREIGRDTV